MQNVQIERLDAYLQGPYAGLGKCDDNNQALQLAPRLRPQLAYAPICFHGQKVSGVKGAADHVLGHSGARIHSVFNERK